ncbi:MAG: DUF2500 domain-containing protein, partial [Propionicimonas sp.]
MYAFVGLGIVALLGLAATPSVLAAISAARRRAIDDAAPHLVGEARVVEKRTQVTGDDSVPDQRYFVTFELPSGDRFELAVPATQAGLLVVGDEGRLSWQGHRYLGFQREILR